MPREQVDSINISDEHLDEEQWAVASTSCVELRREDTAV